MSDFYFGTTYEDDDYIYQNVRVSSSVAIRIPRRILKKHELKAIGFPSSLLKEGWENYAFYERNPETLLMRKKKENGLPKPRKPSPKSPSRKSPKTHKSRNSPKTSPKTSPKSPSPKSRNSPKYQNLSPKKKNRPEYKKQLLSTLKSREKEAKYQTTNYFTFQTDLTPKIRILVLHWMYQLIKKLGLSLITLFTAIKLMDLFLKTKKVSRHKLQLVGTTAVLIAGKYETRISPSIDDYVFLTARKHTHDEFRRVENLMLKELNWEVNVPSEFHFLEIFAFNLHYQENQIKDVAKILMVIVMAPSFLDSTPSFKAALALFIYRNRKWDKKLEKMTTYDKSDLTEGNLQLDVDFLNKYGDLEEVKEFKEVINQPSLPKSPRKSPKTLSSPQRKFRHK